MDKKKMNMNIQLFGSPNTLTGITALDDTQIEKVLLSRLLPTLRAYQDGQKAILKKNAGSNIEWTRFESLEDKDSTLAEGTVPETDNLEVTPIPGKVKQYGRAIIMTDELLNRGKHKCKAEAAELLREEGRKIIDTVTIAEMLKANKTYYGREKTNTTITASDYISDLEIEKARVYLANNNAIKFDDQTYHALIDPLMAADVMNLPGFIEKAKYQDPQGKGLVYGEIGRYKGITFIETTNISTINAGESDAVVCHQMIVYGKDAYGVVDVEDEQTQGRPKLIWKGLGSSGTEDPVNQKASYGIKIPYTAKILDEKRICKLVAPVIITLD